jgi:hypothetical protein
MSLRVPFHVGFDLITSCSCVHDTFLIIDLYQDILIQLIYRLDVLHDLIVDLQIKVTIHSIAYIYSTYKMRPIRGDS